MNTLFANREATIQQMTDDFLRGHHCSEVVFTKLGLYYDKDFDPAMMRLATGFGGGIAECADVCGALVGGIMLIGHLYGRSNLEGSQYDCWHYSKQYHERFLADLGSTCCSYFTDGQFNPENHRKCAEVVTKAATILMGILPPPKE